MRNLFQSKNHKKEESIRLQKQLQREEERLFKIEQAKRKIIQTRDEEFARRLQQQLQLEEQQSSSPRVVPSPEQQRPQQHSQLSRQQESLTDEEFARILQEQLDAEEFQEQSRSPPPAPPARQQEVRHTISDEEYARQLQEQFELEEREFQHNQQLRQPGSPHQQQQYTMPVPALPPRNSGYTTERQMPLPSLPAKPAAYYQHSPVVDSASPMNLPGSTSPSLTPSTSYRTTTWNQNLGEQYQQLLLSSSTASPSVQHASAGDSIQPYPPLQAPSSPSSYHAPQQLPSPVMHPPSSPSALILTAPLLMPITSSPHIVSQERHQQSQQQSYEVNNSGVSLYPNSSSSSPVPTHQQVSLPYQQQYQPQPHVPGSPLTVVTAFPQNNQVSSCHPNVAPQPYNQSIYPQGCVSPHSEPTHPPPLPTASSPNGPVMFIVPMPNVESGNPPYQGPDNRQRTSTFIPMPAHENHISPVYEQPQSVMYSYPSPSNVSAPTQQYPYPPCPSTSSSVQHEQTTVQQQQQQSPTHQYPYPPRPSTSSPVKQEPTSVQQQQYLTQQSPGPSTSSSSAQQKQASVQPEQPSAKEQRQSVDPLIKGKGPYQDPIPPPARFTQKLPQNNNENASSDDDVNPMSSAHAFLATVSTKSLDNDGGDLPDHEHKKARDLLDKEHVADEHPSAEEKQREEGYKATHPSLLEEKPPAAFFKIKTKSTPIAPPQQEQKAFNPADVVYEEDIIDLNAPEQCSTDGEDDTSDDGSVVLDQPNISVDPVATAVQTDNVVPKSQDVSKGGTSLADREDKDDTVVPLQFGREENRTNDAKAQKKEELEGTPRDNRAEIQRRLAEQMKKHGGITRVDPTFKIINMTPPASRSIESNKHEDSASDEERIKVDKIAEDIEEDRSTPTVRPMSAMTSTPFLHSAHPSSYMLVTFDQPLISAGSPPYPGTGHLQNLRPASPYLNHHGSYDNTTYMMTPMVYPENLVKAGAPPGMFSPGEHIETTNEVPNADYGYYLVDNSEPAKEDETKKGSEPISAAEGSKKRPEIPSSDPNNRHITVPSVNPGQRVWIRVKPNDTGKSLAQRIHVVATYKSKKILTIKSTSGRIIPLDDTPVFQDWNEIIKLEDGEPWEVEWGPLEHSLLAGIDFLKQIKIKANMRAKE